MADKQMSSSSKDRPIRVGFTFNLRRVSNKDSDREAEFDSPETIAAIHKAIEAHGHEVVDLEATSELLLRLPGSGVDVVFNISEGVYGRSREAQVPAILEMLDIPYTGSDPLTLALSLDKALAKRVVAQSGLRTAPFVVMSTGRESLPARFTFPAIAKPVAEGSSRGIMGKCVAESEPELRALVPELAERYGQAVLVEGFLPGREFTVGVLGESPKALPILEVIFTKPEQKFPVYSFASKFHGADDVRFEVPAKLDERLKDELEAIALGCFEALDCRDFARIDFRLDAEGHPSFIECNPLPGLSPGFSDFCVIAQAAGLDHTALVGRILAPALGRLRQKRG
ncbi:MAG: hypothetical protein HY791_09705 [Deltaproteobacteria bacterium]|nr:hypothetical protein [Deltaproteobacteria bacterium]